MAKNLFQTVQRLLDVNGALEPNATIEIYKAGTTTPQQLYSDRALAVTAGFSVVADATGAPPERWIPDGTQIKLVYKSAGGATTYTRDYANDNGVGLSGETLNATRASGGAIALTNNTVANVTSVVLTPGKWLVSGLVVMGFTTSGPSFITAASSAVSATLPANLDVGSFVQIAGTLSADNFALSLSPIEVTVAGPGNTTFYLLARAGFGGGGTAYGRILATRLAFP